jgi:ABC-type proline/glycine betaine transport system substrate-binding protein
MARPQVTNRGDGPQIWRVAGNMLNKKSGTAEKGWSSNLGVGHGAKNATVKNKLFTKDHKKPRTWTDSLEKRAKRKKINMRFGTWNVRSMYRAGSLKAVAEEISKYKFDLVGE